MAAYDMHALKAYVQGGAPRQLAAGVALLDVQHNLIQQQFVEIPFDVTQTIADVKDRVYTLCGSSPEHMHVYLNRNVYLENETRTLASYGCQAGVAGQFLWVEDRDPFSAARGGALHDTSLVQKYVMSDDEYRKRDNTYYAYKQKMKAQDPTWQSMFQAKAKQQHEQEGSSSSAAADLPESPHATLERVKLGMRCEVSPGGRRGVVSYVGPIPELTPHPLALPTPANDGAAAPAADAAAPVFFVWVGVTLDEPVASHDGIIHGKRYFTAPAKRGTFAKPWLVQVGDFPERDPFDELDDEDDDNKEDNKGKSDAAKDATDDLYAEM